MKTTFDIQELETLARQFEASVESIRAQTEAQAAAILAAGERQAAEYQRMAEAHRLVIQSLQGAGGAAEALYHQIQRVNEAVSSQLAQTGLAGAQGTGEAAEAFYRQIQRANEAGSSHLAQTGLADDQVGTSIEGTAAAFARELGSVGSAQAGVVAQVTSLMDAGRWLIETKGISTEFDVGRFRDQIESAFQEIAKDISDRNAYSKVLLKLAEAGDITIKERGRGRRPSIYEIASANGGDAM